MRGNRFYSYLLEQFFLFRRRLRGHHGLLPVDAQFSSLYLL